MLGLMPWNPLPGPIDFLPDPQGGGGNSVPLWVVGGLLIAAGAAVLLGGS